MFSTYTSLIKGQKLFLKSFIALPIQMICPANPA
jgi:hypothetical protein